METIEYPDEKSLRKAVASLRAEIARLSGELEGARAEVEAACNRLEELDDDPAQVVALNLRQWLAVSTAHESK